MNYQKILDSTGIYPIQEHLLAMKAGYKCSRLSESLYDNILELKWNRNGEAQNLIYKMLETITDKQTILDTDKIDELIQMVTADKIINDTPHTFGELNSNE